MRGDTRGGWASAAGNSGRGSVLVRRVVGVEPEHRRGVVVPEGEGQNHTVTESLAELLEAAVLVEVVGVAEDFLLLGTEVLGDGVDGVDSGDVDVGVLDHLAVLDVDAADLRESSGGGVVAGQELGDNCERLGSVDGHAGAQESGVAETEGVEVTTVGVAETCVPSAVITGAASLTVGRARVRGKGSSDAVGLPDIHLTAASTKAADTSVGASGIPTLNVTLATMAQ